MKQKNNMYTAEEIRNVETLKDITERAIEQLIYSANFAHLNYVFIDKNLLSPERINQLKELGYTVVIGYGDTARIKISW